jgi:head-tail adaptor
MLTATELARLRADSETLMPDAATRHAQAVVSDGGGGFTETFTAAGTFSCHVAPIGGGERVVGGRISDRTTHVLSVPAGTTISAADRVVVDGKTFEVTAVRTRSWEIVRRVEVRELD